MEAEILAMMIPIVAIIANVALLTVIVFLIYRSRRKRLDYLHAERMAALDKGLPVPMDYNWGRRRRPFVSGLIWTAIGIGFMIMGWLATENDAQEMAGVGSIPLLIGVALIIGDALEQKRIKSEQDRVTLPYLAVPAESHAGGNRS
jgi:hypothetical protein